MTQEIKLYAVITKDDGGIGADFNASQIQKVLDEANKTWATVDIKFTLDASNDITQIDSTLLNEDTSPGDYWKNARARSAVAGQHFGRLVVFFRDYKEASTAGYGFGGGGDFMVMPKDDSWWSGGRLFAHEVGHYLHLPHTFPGLGLEPQDNTAPDAKKIESLREQQINQIKDYVAHGHDEADGLNVFDGDRPSVLDTPPDDGGQIINLLNGGDSGGPIDEVEIEVDFPTKKRKYLLKFDRSNIMSYFHKVAHIPQHVSQGQLKVVRACLENGNRKHLVAGAAWAKVPEKQAEFAPTAVTWGPERLDLFARGSDKRVYSKVWEQSTGKWWPGQLEWQDLGGEIVGAPVALTWGLGRLDLFVCGADGRVYNKVWEQSTGKWWPGQLDWKDLGGSVSGPPTAVTWGPGRLDLFVLGKDGRVYNKVWEKSTGKWWPGQLDWADLGGSVLGSPEAVTGGLGRLDLFARGSDGRIYNKVWEQSTGKWWPGQLDWADLGAPSVKDVASGTVLSTPTAVTWGPGRLDLFARGSDTRVYSKVWEQSTGKWWPGQLEWQDLGGEIVGAPVALTWGPGRLDLFVRNINGAVESKAWDVSGNGWYPGQESWSFLGFPG